jgi:site-specific recombinase XerD
VTTPAGALLEAGGDLERGRLTLTQAARSYLRWLEAHGYAKNTLLSYGHGLSEFLRYAAGVKLTTPSDVTILGLDGYFVWLQARGTSARSAAHRRSVLIALWAWLEHEGFADRNIAAKTYKIKYRRGLPVYLEAHQIDAFLAALAALTDPVGRRDHAIVATLFYSGVRVGELAALRVSSVDTIARRIKVLHGKGDKDRTIVLPPRLAPILDTYLSQVRPRLRAASEAPWLFLVSTARGGAHRNGGRNRRPSIPVRGATEGLLERSIYRIIRDRAREILGVRLAPHKLRHTCASYLLAGGAQLETIQRHLGHTDLATTMIYLHVPQQRQEDEIGRVFA